MAAAAGAPGSGEGGEAEPDSEPISGDDRPRHEHTEASTLHGGMVEELGWEEALDSEEAGHGETGLRLPETDRLPECIGPEVTHWESEMEEPSVVLEASPRAWAQGVEPSVVVDTMVADVLSSQQPEEPMQLGKEFHCPPDPAPEAMEVEETECGVTPSKAECPSDQVHLVHASSPQPQVVSEPSLVTSDPVQVPEDVDTLQEESFPETFALTQDAPELEQDAAPLPIKDCAPLEPSDTVPLVQECTTVEVDDAQEPTETDLVEETYVPDPVPDVFLQVQEPISKEVQETEGEVAPLIGDVSDEDQDSVPEMVIAEPVVVLDKMQHTVMEEPVPEIAMPEEGLKSCMEGFNSVDADNKCVPEAFQEEERVLEVVDHDQEAIESTEAVAEVKLFLQPALDERCHSPNNHVDEECLSNRSPEESSVRLIMSDSIPEDVQSLEEAVSPMDSGISSERRSVEKELDSRSSHMETELTIESSSECTKLVSYSQDVEYDPFYRDTKMEEADVQEEHEALTAPADIVQTDPHMEEPSTKVDACMDNPNPCQDPLSPAQRLVTGGIDDLIPGSEVQVTLDHIIQDALVVSFRHGDRIFSGVLMDLSKRFGPHGIPVTVHPKREYKNKPEEFIEPQSTSFQEEESLKTENGTAPTDVAPIQPTEPCGVSNNNNLWTSKPPPLFHEGAPYPPPLFIRDTYNQSIPQPPPRKIKRLKKKIYREEPTSIMNAIKLRPRQVLCDKCKNVVTDKREVRKTGNDSFKLEEGKRRRHESVTTVNKKLKTDHKVNGKSQSESQKKNPVSKVSNLGHGRGKVVKVASQTHAPKAQLHTKKVLQSKNMDHVKAREVLKMAKEKAQKKQKDASSSKNAHSKVHFTRRLQNTTSGTLPPRLRIKPQRYRNEENDSSLKIGLESLRSSKIGIKPQTRYTATRSAGQRSKCKPLGQMCGHHDMSI
ncbi:PWWP domain-containing protein 2A isoform 2-T2 [Leptodactylus fuscus]|uniref:PWWP domain-containing protein 2A isoform X2 n=1 Tax=Leptodactylus fuscus TaxID=238119 RepID=UPI003F4F1A93